MQNNKPCITKMCTYLRVVAMEVLTRNNKLPNRCTKQYD